MKLKKMWKACFVSLLIGALVTSEKAVANSKSEDVVVALDWTPNTNHTGIFVAKNLGWFAEKKLNVKIIQPNQTTATALVASGTAQFGISFTGDVINARSSGLNVKSIAAIIPSNTSCFAWRESSGIKTMKDWEGKKYGGWGSPEESAALKYLTEKQGVNFSKIKIVTTGVSDFLPTTKKNADFMWIFMAWDGIRAKLANVKIQTLCPKDVDPLFNTGSPLIIASDKTLKENFNLAKLFLQAVSKGYEYAAEQPQKAAKILLKEVPELDEKLVVESALYLAPKYLENKKWGMQKNEKWVRYLEYVKQQQLTQNLFAVESYVTNEVLLP